MFQAHIHTWKGHTKGIAAVRWFPGTAHLMLSAGMDCRVKVMCWVLLSPFNSFRIQYNNNYTKYPSFILSTPPGPKLSKGYTMDSGVA